jgi:AcrR family transcriptional regulator
MSPKVSDEHREQRRSELLKSALECISERGYERTTVDDIVRWAGVSKGMLYNYFKSKEEIFFALIDDRTDAFFEQMSTVFQSLPGAWEKLHYLLDMYSKTPLRDDSRKWVGAYLEFFLTTSRSPSRTEYMQQRHERFVQLLKVVVDEGKRTGEFRSDIDSSSVSALYWALCDGIHLHLSQLPQIDDYDEVYRTAIHMLYLFVVNNPSN